MSEEMAQRRLRAHLMRVLAFVSHARQLATDSCCSSPLREAATSKGLNRQNKMSHTVRWSFEPTVMACGFGQCCIALQVYKDAAAQASESGLSTK